MRWEEAPYLEFQGVTVSYRRLARATQWLRDVSLSLRSGDFIAVRDSSRRAIFQLAAVAAGLATPESGSVLVHGHDVDLLSEPQRHALRRRRVVVFGASPNLLPRAPLWVNVAVPLLVEDTDDSQCRRQAVAALETVGLEGVWDEPAEGLDLEDARLVELARWRVSGARVAVCDNPTLGLSPAEADDMCRALRGMCREGCAVLLTTSDAKAAAFADDTYLVQPDNRLASSNYSTMGVAT